MSFRSAFLVAVSALISGCAAETFTSTGPTGLEVVHGPPPIVSLGTELDTLLAVRVVDEAGEPRSGVRVIWKVVDGDGELIPVDSLSGVDGLTLARWKFRYVPGLQRVQVQIDGQDLVTLSTEARGFRAVQVTAGYSHGCGIDADGGTWCWGGDSLRLGNPALGSYTLRPTPVAGGHTFVEVRAGGTSTCGRTASGEVWCWGYNFGGALGQATGHSALPLQVPGLPSMVSITAGGSTVCGLAADSTTWCWGNGTVGGATATQVVTSLVFVELAVADDHTCGLTAAGVTYCWGSNFSGALGDSGASRNAPTGPVMGSHQFREIVPANYATCGLDLAGAVWCWGSGIGLPEMPFNSPNAIPVRIQLPAGVSSLAAGQGWVGGIGVGGTAHFREYFGSSELGAPFEQLGISQVAGQDSFCGISRSGEVYCSGGVVDQVNCSSVSPWGCAPTGPIPLPAGGRVYGYPPFGD